MASLVNNPPSVSARHIVGRFAGDMRRVNSALKVTLVGGEDQSGAGMPHNFSGNGPDCPQSTHRGAP